MKKLSLSCRSHRNRHGPILPPTTARTPGISNSLKSAQCMLAGKHGRSGLSNGTIHVPILFAFRVGIMHDEELLAIIDSDDNRRWLAAFSLLVRSTNMPSIYLPSSLGSGQMHAKRFLRWAPRVVLQKTIGAAAPSERMRVRSPRIEREDPTRNPALGAVDLPSYAEHQCAVRSHGTGIWTSASLGSDVKELLEFPFFLLVSQAERAAVL
ncbi:hypothetical protein EV421DRAFT_2020470 [Armillaria borealis]|uniref:Uncharacterized protein n=1 Tax=Armillaria borealis TaxID=47425 RepID=A0AA39JGF8_9AGAR|nr:hypothetical protein EV421DRAFT_2020470 [Armillaria borealis]